MFAPKSLVLSPKFYLIRRNLPSMDSFFKGASLIVVGSVVRVERGFSAAIGCSARLSAEVCAGADAKVAARGQAGGGRQAPARHRPGASGDDDGGGYQLRGWTKSKAGSGWSRGSRASAMLSLN
jgi:hypothetical protein